ncbi:hypothetical protein, partial [Streptomyces fildesensis]|uniref:hypothetical protein n=1 Tax=Streptomyces fildesensis TaxID=375757 RepID=UPI001E3F1040
MNTKKELGGLFGLFGSLVEIFPFVTREDCFFVDRFFFLASGFDLLPFMVIQTWRFRVRASESR